MEPENYKPSLPPAVIVHGLAQAEQANSLGLPVTLLSSPNAACAWGCLWWQSLLMESGHTGPALLDCGTSPGRAVEALELGLKGIILPLCPAWPDIKSLAIHKQALLLPTSPPSLDLGQKHAERWLSAWLGG